MKKIVLLTILILICSRADAANRYWVGGNATWDATAGSKWALTSGGSGGEAVPTASDDCFFDAGSAGAIVTTSGTTTDVCRSIDFNGFTGEFSHAASTTVSIGDGTAGIFRLVAGMTYTRGSATTSDFNFVSTTSGNNLTFAGKQVGDVLFNGVAGTWTIVDALTQASTSTVTLTNGTLVMTGTSGNSFGIFSSSNSNTRVLTITNAAITIQSTGNAWNCSTSTNMTVNGSGSTITFTGAGTTVFNAGGSGGGTLLYGTVVHNQTQTLQIVSGNNLTMENFPQSTSTKSFLFTGNITVTITGGTDFGNTSNIITIGVISGSTAFTISKTSGTHYMRNLVISNSTVSGGATFYAIDSINNGNNTGWTWLSGLQAGTWDAGTYS